MGTTIRHVRVDTKHCAVYTPHAAIPGLFRASCSLCTWQAENYLTIDEALEAFKAHREGRRQPRHWLAWAPGEFDSQAPPVQLSMFAAPDPLGTGDLFAGDES